MGATIENIEQVLSDINYLINRNYNTYKTAKRNGYIYIQEIKTNDTILNFATTKKRSLYSFESI